MGQRSTQILEQRARYGWAILLSLLALPLTGLLTKLFPDQLPLWHGVVGATIMLLIFNFMRYVAVAYSLREALDVTNDAAAHPTPLRKRRSTSTN